MDGKSGFYGLLTIVLAAVCLGATHRLLPSLFSLLIKGALFLLLLLAILVAVVLYFAFKKPSDKKSPAQNEEKAILAKGRSNLLELRQLNMKVRNMQVRSISDEICKSVDKILQTLKEQPESIPSVRKFFNYYLPTLGGILQKYVRIEQSGVPSGEMTENVLSCLKDIKTAMDRQYENLFDDDMLDLTVEMEVLTAVCKRDGLLPDEEIRSAAQNTMNLTL